MWIRYERFGFVIGYITSIIILTIKYLQSFIQFFDVLLVVEAMEAAVVVVECLPTAFRYVLELSSIL